jgi:peptidyl-prolyl cis-trans isomerase B (cyclophilin B)
MGHVSGQNGTERDNAPEGNVVLRGFGVAVAAGCVLLATACGGGTASGSSSETPAPAGSSGAALTTGACRYTPSGQPAAKENGGLPDANPAAGPATRVATLKTSAGTVVVSLAAKAAPCTVNSFVHLATAKFFNGTSCHRLTTAGIFVLQCGDPTGSGTGDPGYKFLTENQPTGKTPPYPAGTVAMANSGSPDSNGSQFFIVYQDTTLPADYTVFGTVTTGLQFVQAVAAKGSNNANGSGDGAPKQKVTIQSVVV